MGAKDTSAPLPVQAFGEAYPFSMACGALFKFRGHWAMRVAYSEGKTDQAFLVLQGQHAGQLHRIGHGMPRALCVVAPFSWFAVVDPGDPAAHDALNSASIAIGEHGPVIVGGDTDGDHFAFDLSGHPWADYPSQAAMTRFDRWSAHLAFADRPFRSLGTICIVDRRAGKDGPGA